MKIKILKDEYLFSQDGCHICDSSGFAVKAQDDQDCEVNEQHSDRVISLLSQDRSMRGLMPDGSLPVVEELKVPQDIIDAELAVEIKPDPEPGADSSEF